MNLAACIAAAERKTLLVDLDPQSNATSGIGVEKQTDGKSTYEIIGGTLDATEVLQKTQMPYLSIIPSHINLVGAEVELDGVEDREGRLREALKPVRDL